MRRSNPLGGIADSLDEAAVTIPHRSLGSRKRKQAEILAERLESTPSYPESAWTWNHYVGERNLTFQAARSSTRVYPMRNIIDLKIQLMKMGRIPEDSHIGSQMILKECEKYLRERNGEFILPHPSWITFRESQGFENANRGLKTFVGNWDPVDFLKKKSGDSTLVLESRSIMDVIGRIGRKSAEEKELQKRQEELNKARHLLGEYFKDVKLNLFGNVEIFNFSRNDDMPHAEKKQLCQNVLKIISKNPELVFVLIEMCPSAVRGVYPELVRLSENDVARSLMIQSIYGGQNAQGEDDSMSMAIAPSSSQVPQLLEIPSIEDHSQADADVFPPLYFCDFCNAHVLDEKEFTDAHEDCNDHSSYSFDITGHRKRAMNKRMSIYDGIVIWRQGIPGVMPAGPLWSPSEKSKRHRQYYPMKEAHDTLNMPAFNRTNAMQTELAFRTG